MFIRPMWTRLYQITESNSPSQLLTLTLTQCHFQDDLVHENKAITVVAEA